MTASPQGTVLVVEDDQANLALADTYDAITTDRPYRPARPPALAFEELWLEVTRGLRRPDLVDAFITLCRDGALTRVWTVVTGRL